MLNRIIAALFLLFLGLTSAVFFIAALVIWALTVTVDRRLVVLHLFTSFWASLYLWIMPAWSVHVDGRRPDAWKRNYVIVSNHQSQLDILVAFRLFIPFKWVSKAALPKHSLNFHGRQHMHIRVLEPIDAEQVAAMSVEDLTDIVRARVADHLEELTPA